MSDPPPNSPFTRSAQADLLAALVSPGPIYPWDPSPVETDGVEADLGAEDCKEGMIDDDDALDICLAEGWQRLSSHLLSQWNGAAERQSS